MSVVNLPPILRIMWMELEARVRKLESAQVFQAPSFTADPTVLRNGMIWYRSDINQYKAYQNNTVVTLIEGTEGAWTSYAPVLGGTGWAAGNATVSGAYATVGKTVHFRTSFVFGSTSTFGAGIPTITLPVANVSTTANVNFNIGYFNAGVLYKGSNNYQSVTTIGLLALVSSVGALAAVSSTAPFTWASGSAIYVSGTYQSA